MARCIRAVLLSCLVITVSEARAQAPPFLPLEVGNSWTYVQVLEPPNSAPDTLSGGTFSISERISINDTTYYVTPHPFALADTLRSDGEGRIWARAGGRDVLLFDFTLADGEKYVFGSASDAQMEFDVSIRRGLTVDVVAGTFEGAVALRFDVPESVDEERTFAFAPGVGIVEAFGPVGDYVELHSATVRPRADTLDWRGYYPLAVGNVWQYAFETWHGTLGTLGEWVEHREITGDSLLDGETYSVMEVRCDTTLRAYPELFTHSCDPSRLERRFIRYDESAANLFERRIVGGAAEEHYFFDYDFRLDAPLHYEGESTGGMAASYSYFPAERPLSIDGQEVNAPQKIISVSAAVPGSFVFAHGIGLASAAFSEDGGTRQELTYARVDGVSYGTLKPVTTDSPTSSPANFTFDLFPNPAVNDLRIELSLARTADVRLLMYDILGRQVLATVLGHRTPGTHGHVLEAHKFSSGTYIIAVELGGDVVVRKSIVIVR